MYGHTQNSDALVEELTAIAATLPSKEKSQLNQLIKEYTALEGQVQYKFKALLEFYRRAYSEVYENVNYNSGMAPAGPDDGSTDPVATDAQKPRSSTFQAATNAPDAPTEATENLAEQKRLFDRIKGYLNQDDALLAAVESYIDRLKDFPKVPASVFAVLRATLDAYYESVEALKSSIEINGRLSPQELENLNQEVVDQAKARSDVHSAIESLLGYLPEPEKTQLNDIKVKLEYQDTQVREAFDDLAPILGSFQDARQEYPVALANK